MGANPVGAGLPGAVADRVPAETVLRDHGASRGLVIYVRHRLDISVRDLLFGLSACVGARDREKLTAEVLRACSLEEDGIACLSVRSGFDLLLEALALPRGSEVLVSAIMHPDMVRLIGAHGLVAVPVDLDPETLAPRPELLEAARTERTELLLIAHLFGGRVDPGPLAGFAREHGLLLVEDRAQDFRGPNEMGYGAADVSMYSFGPIKTATALGGAVLRVRDRRTRERMRAIEAPWPVQRRREYAGKLITFLLFDFLARPLPYGLLVRLCDLLGRDLDSFINAASRGFPKRKVGREGALPQRLRRRSATPLLAVLARRLGNFDGLRLQSRALSGERAARLLYPSVALPGRLADEHTHWLFPVVAEDPDVLISALRREGFDASRATSSIAAVPPPAGRPELAPARARTMMENVVFLPVYPELPDGALRRLARTVAAFADQKRGAGP